VSALFFALLDIAIAFRCPYRPLSDDGLVQYDRTRWQEYARAVKPQ